MIEVRAPTWVGRTRPGFREYVQLASPIGQGLLGLQGRLRWHSSERLNRDEHDGSALPPRPVSFAAVVLVGTVLLVILLGWGLLKIGRVTLVNLVFRRDSFLVELLLGVAGLAACLACFVAIVHGLLPD